MHTKEPFGFKQDRDTQNDGQTVLIDDEGAKELIELREAIEALTGGLRALGAMVIRQEAMLKEILKACTAEDSDKPSPLVKAILKLDGAIASQTESLARIEAGLGRP